MKVESHNMRVRRRIPTGVCLAAVIAFVTACSGSPEDERVPDDWLLTASARTKLVPSYEQYQRKARVAAGDANGFLVETDMFFETEAQLREYYDELYVKPRPKSVLNMVNGVRDVRSTPKDIRYCFAAGWGENQGAYTAPALGPVQASIQAATASWQAAAGVSFRHVSALDGVACTNSGANPGVDFVVQHYSNASTAIGPFPSNTWANQQLRVPTSGISRLLAIHELGHTLGFRHEHIHTDATPQCSEGGTKGINYEELTGFDTLSCMKYWSCTLGVINGTEVSELDGIGVRMAYGPPDWWWEVLR